MNFLSKINQSLLTPVPIQRTGEGFTITQEKDELSAISFQFRPHKLIFPTREGELIEDLSKVEVGGEYSLTYPGTASTKCIVVYQEDYNIFIGGKPAYDYCRITLQRKTEDLFVLTFVAEAHDLFLFPFTETWRSAIKPFQQHFQLHGKARRVTKPKYMLQLGVKDSFRNVYITHFDELKPAIELFREHFGPGNIVHFFGTNKDGFDRMFPDYTIDPALGGCKALGHLIDHAKSLQLYTSHHYNPRIADTNWMKLHPEFQKAIVRKNDEEVVEPYKDHPHYVMNPNDEDWFRRCFETIQYLHAVGFDYLEIDQFTYQRNFYHPGQPLAKGYKKIVDKFVDLGIKFWLEGVSDVFRLNNGNFYQILIRDNSQLWEDNENRRGYPYGRTYAEFFMSLFPDSEVSYQIFTENKLFDLVPERFEAARKNGAAVYDIELGFYDDHYIDNLNQVIRILNEHGSL